MNDSTEEAPRWRRRLLWLLWALAVASALVLVIRLISLWRSALWLQLANAEGINLYALWRLRNGYPLYESVGEPYVSFTPYNFLFYFSYAGLMEIFHVSGPRMAFAARLPTLACAGLGAWILFRTARRLSNDLYGNSDTVLLALLAFIAWIGCGIVGWSALAIRPDVMAAMLTFAGLSLMLRFVQRGRDPGWMLIAASLLYAAAWAAKHSYLMGFIATAGYLAIVRRRIGELLRFVVPYALIIITAVLAGTPGYYFAIFTAQARDPVRVHEAQFWLRAGLLTNLMMWAVPVWSTVAMVRARLQTGARIPQAFVFLGFVAAGVAAWTLVTIGKLGASEHYLIEASVIAALWSSVMLSGWAAGQPRARDGFRLATWTAVPMLLFVTGLLTGPDLLRIAIGLRARGDKLVLGIPGELGRRQEIAARMTELPPPVYIDDQTLAQPWFSNRGQYPAPVAVVDPSYRKGLQGMALSDLFETKYFGSAILNTSDVTQRPRLLRAGYVHRGTLPGPMGDTLEIYTR